MTSLTHTAVRLPLGALASLALMIGVVVIGQETARAGLQVGAQTRSVNAYDVGQSHALEVERCDTALPYAAHHCHCLECRSSIVRPSADGLRHPKETLVLPFHLWTSSLSTARALHGVALHLSGDERAFLGGRDLLVRAARLLL